MGGGVNVPHRGIVPRVLRVFISCDSVGGGESCDTWCIGPDGGRNTKTGGRGSRSCLNQYCVLWTCQNGEHIMKSNNVWIMFVWCIVWLCIDLPISDRLDIGTRRKDGGRGGHTCRLTCQPSRCVHQEGRDEIREVY